MLPLEMVIDGLKRFLGSAAHGVLAASRETGKFWMSFTILQHSGGICAAKLHVSFCTIYEHSHLGPSGNMSCLACEQKMS